MHLFCFVWKFQLRREPTHSTDYCSLQNPRSEVTYKSYWLISILISTHSKHHNHTSRCSRRFIRLVISKYSWNNTQRDRSYPRTVIRFFLEEPSTYIDNETAKRMVICVCINSIGASCVLKFQSRFSWRKIELQLSYCLILYGIVLNEILEYFCTISNFSDHVNIIHTKRIIVSTFLSDSTTISSRFLQASISENVEMIHTS